MEAGRKDGGKLELLPSAWQQLSDRASTSSPFGVVLSAQAANTDRNTCEVAGSDTPWPCKHPEDQGELVRQPLLSSPCQSPFSSAAGSGDSLTSLFPLA